MSSSTIRALVFTPHFRNQTADNIGYVIVGLQTIRISNQYSDFDIQTQLS
jgi:hypothetical protein